MENLMQKRLWVYFLVILFMPMSAKVFAQPVIDNPVMIVKSINGDEPELKANPSDPGIFAGDLNDDGIYDYLQPVLQFNNIRDEDSEDTYDTIVQSYDEFGRTVKSAFIPGLYFAVGDMDGDGIEELATQNADGDIEIVSFADTEESPFSRFESTVVESPPGEMPRADWSGTGDLNTDGIVDALFCENEFESYNRCIYVNGVMFSNQATTPVSQVFDFTDQEYEFSIPPQLVIDNSIAGDGDSFYAIGTIDNYTKDVLVEFGVDENGDFISLLENEWVTTSGESIYGRRYYFDDVDGDGETEIISSDDREFPLAGFRRIYFNNPVCDFREVDYTGDEPVIQNPEVISNNCVVDRTFEDEDDNYWIGVWQSGNYKACDSDQIPTDCSEEPFINDDQTILPLPYRSAQVQNQPNNLFFNGVADPSVRARGLQAMTISPTSGLIFSQLFLISEILRVAEIYRAFILTTFVNQTTNSLIRTALFGGTVQDDQSCSMETQACQLSRSSYYVALQSDGPVNTGGRVIGSEYRHYTAGRIPNGEEGTTLYVSVTVDDRENYVPANSDLEFDELDKVRPKVSDLVEYDTLSATSEINLSPLGSFDDNYLSFTVKNIGDIDGVPGEELLIGSNSMSSGGQAVNKAWIYLGENTTYEEPDYEIDFSNDSTIDATSFIGLGQVAEGLGDVNGDGIGDFAVGIPRYDERYDDVSYGAVYVFTGIDRTAAKVAADTTTFETPFAILRPEEADYVIGRFGAEISGGDYDGDGFNDIAVLADYGSSMPASPTIRVFKGGEEMDAVADYFLNVTEEEVGGFSTDTVSSFYEAVVHFMPEEEGADHQDLYFTPGAYSGYPDAVIFRGGIDEQAKRRGINAPATTPSVTLAEAGPATTGSGVYSRFNPATGDLNGDGKYEVIVEKQYDGRDGAVSSRLLIFSPNADIVIDSNEELENPFGYRLSQNYPNPFNPSTNIEFRLGNASEVTLKIYDVLGREVATLINNERFTQGSHTVRFEASALASGIYLYKLQTNGFTQTRKMMLIK
jgi:hypothetical protein